MAKTLGTDLSIKSGLDPKYGMSKKVAKKLKSMMKKKKVAKAK